MKLKDLITEKSDKIQIPGVGVSSYDNLKRNVNKKVQDLLKRSKKGSHMGVGESQFKLSNFPIIFDIISSIFRFPFGSDGA